GKVVRGNFFTRHRSFISTGAVAACACLFAAVGLKPYLTGIEDKAAKGVELESMPSMAPDSDLVKTLMEAEHLSGNAGPGANAGSSEAPPSAAAPRRKEMARPSNEALGALEETMDSVPSESKGGASNAIVVEGLKQTLEGERRQLGRSSESGAAASEPASSPPAIRRSLPAPAPTPGARPKDAPQKAGESDTFAEGLTRAAVPPAPTAIALPRPSDGIAMVPSDPADAGPGVADASKRGTVVRAKPSAKSRAVVESRSFGLEVADGAVPKAESKKPKLAQDFDLDERGVAELVRGRVAQKPADNFASGESYGHLVDNPWVSTWEDGLSTFAIDVDTGTYPNVRRFLMRRASLPPRDAVRIEEMVNYFNYDYPEPKGSEPFSVNMEVASCPWAKDHRLLRVGLRGKGVEVDKRPPSNLVFLIDVSGSMRGNDKLELLRRSMKAMVSQLNEDDRIGIVTYAGQSGVVLEPTHGDQKGKIISVLDQLGAGGSTNGAAGIMTAYSLAIANFVEGGTNRVILATDGDFNVGVTGNGDLIRLVEERAREKVFLTVLGVGEGNLQEHRMEQVADKGNGSYHYLDSEAEGEKVLVRGLGATLVTVAKDVKVQIDFNPAAVEKYRLIGYANRMMPDEAFNDPTADAGEIGAGHTVTALYEIVPAAAEA
ncbi:MAG: YfbK domain-containing protein, partial [Verrucomicrobiales bacterium]